MRERTEDSLYEIGIWKSGEKNNNCRYRLERDSGSYRQTVKSGNEVSNLIINRLSERNEYQVFMDYVGEIDEIRAKLSSGRFERNLRYLICGRFEDKQLALLSSIQYGKTSDFRIGNFRLGIYEKSAECENTPLVLINQTKGARFQRRIQDIEDIGGFCAPQVNRKGYSTPEFIRRKNEYLEKQKKELEVLLEYDILAEELLKRLGW